MVLPSIESIQKVLGTFPKAFSPRATSQVTVSQVATSQMYIFPMGKCTFATWEIVTWVNVHLGSFRLFFMGKLPLWKLSFRKMYIWEVATWKNTLGKLPLGKYLNSEFLGLLNLRFVTAGIKIQNRLQ